MKKNILFLIIDAMTEYYTSLDEKYSPTPFIDKMKKDGVYCSNMYSQGPYTEAALTPFYTGRDNMFCGGNFFRGNEVDKTTFEYLSEAGYDVLVYTQPLIFPDPMHRGVNEERYGVSYFISAVWDYRLSYFKNLFLNNELDEKDFDKIYTLLDSNFTFAIQYIEEYQNSNPKFDFINKYVGAFDSNKNLSLLTKEYEVYKQDKKKYVIELFNYGLKHRLFSLDKIDMNNKANNDFIYDTIKEKYNSLFNKISTFNKKSKANNEYNLFNSIVKLLGSFFKLDAKQIKQVIKKYHYYRRLCSTKNEINLMFKQKSNYKPEPSFMRYYEHFKNWLENRSSNKPFFCMMHVSDLHTPEIFFSIDSINIKEVEEELDIMNKYIDELPQNTKGNIIYLLSMRFVDLCVERIVNDFKKTDFFDNTVIMLSADHGSSFRLWPIRDSVVNNMHSENYNIPFIICNEGHCFKNTNFYTTKDMMKTTLYIADVTNDLDAKNIITNEQSNYMMSEYLGGGCPDIRRRPVFIAYRDEHYHIFAKKSILDKEMCVYEIYDFDNDHYELNNVVDTIKKDDIKNQLEIISNRFDSIERNIK